jgi:four helix bundle protein
MCATPAGGGPTPRHMRTRKGADISLRLLKLSREVIALAHELPPTRLNKHIAFQVERSITAAGSNYSEACYAESRRDFIHKVSVAAKETGETLYWLRLIASLKQDEALEPLAREADELVAILVASARTARSRL